MTQDEMEDSFASAASAEVDADAAEDLIEAKSIGDRIRRLRLKRSMGLVDLGARTGLSASFLSQLETGRVVPTIRNLARIGLFFEKDLSYFFREEKSAPLRISRARDRVRLHHADKGAPYLISESMNSLISNKAMVPCIAEFLPEGGCSFYPQIFTGIEFVYVMEGRVLLSADREKQVLENGDSFWIDGTTKRQYRCEGETPAKAMIITVPQES